MNLYVENKAKRCKEKGMILAWISYREPMLCLTLNKRELKCPIRNEKIYFSETKPWIFLKPGSKVYL